ncbi:histidine phosphatase family protein [Corynebacterium glucuronolyticum]|uniref:Histidine phosphatase family protein n=2 Tax=Corynebacterium glucuronolyticum TaxID=39791 RepID=A0AAX1L8K8_9CORY|nr:histidine phosphatase family protein [Corynebacterium glucuronolyticum]QRP70720.1 histidine phosphatase family protein [Corynebacterium glucuronolyticum]
MARKVFLIRHARQSSDLCNVDVGLSNTGVRQAGLLAERLTGFEIECLYCSDMIRAMQTAEIINSRLLLPLGVESRVRELDFGEMEGLTNEEIRRKFGQFKSDELKFELDQRYPGGENAAEVLERSLSGVLDILNSTSENVAIVTHGVVIRVLVCYSIGAPLQRWRNVARGLENTSISELDVNSAGIGARFSLERLNDYTHLETFPDLLRSNKTETR